MLKTGLCLLIAFVLATACAPTTTTPNATEPAGDAASPTTGAAEPTDDAAQPATPTEATPLNGGETPPALFDAVLADVLAVSGGSRTDVEVLKSEAVVWNDGSLGCPQPDVMYTQALVDGYQVIFRVNGQEYDYHLSAAGDFVLCGNTLTTPLGGTPTE